MTDDVVLLVAQHHILPPPGSSILQFFSSFLRLFLTEYWLRTVRASSLVSSWDERIEISCPSAPFSSLDLLSVTAHAAVLEDSSARACLRRRLGLALFVNATTLLAAVS